MENVLSSEERYKRAYELYLKKNNSSYSTEDNKNTKNSKKIYIQIFSSLFLLSIIIFLKNTNNSYGNVILEKVNENLKYNINIEDTYNKVYEYMKQNVYSKVIDIPEEYQSELKSEEVLEEKNEENIFNENEQKQMIIDNLSQEKQDAYLIKNEYSLIKPVDGDISSRYGERESENKNVPQNHTGIDIAVPINTEIKSAVYGKVIQVSSDGDYGKHIKILTGEDIITLYAHCEEIKVNEGDEVNQGDIIALSGNTGNTTGPHLHFEIRKGNRFVNPEYVLDF